MWCIGACNMGCGSCGVELGPLLAMGAVRVALNVPVL